jgi:hypothetical protein
MQEQGTCCLVVATSVLACGLVQLTSEDACGYVKQHVVCPYIQDGSGFLGLGNFYGDETTGTV